MQNYNVEVKRLRDELCRKFITTGNIDRGITEQLMAYCERRKCGEDLPAMPSPRSYVPVKKRSGHPHQPDLLPSSRTGQASRRRQSHFRDFVVKQLVNATEHKRRCLGQLRRAVNEAADPDEVKKARWTARSAAQQRRRARERAAMEAIFEKQEALYHEFLVGACVRSA